MPRMTTVLRPGNYRPDHRFSKEDYVSIPALSVRGSFPLWQMMRLTADTRLQSERNAQEVIRMMTDSFDRMGQR